MDESNCEACSAVPKMTVDSEAGNSDKCQEAYSTETESGEKPLQEELHTSRESSEVPSFAVLELPHVDSATSLPVESKEDGELTSDSDTSSVDELRDGEQLLMTANNACDQTVSCEIAVENIKVEIRDEFDVESSRQRCASLVAYEISSESEVDDADDLTSQHQIANHSSRQLPGGLSITAAREDGEVSSESDDAGIRIKQEPEDAVMLETMDDTVYNGQQYSDYIPLTNIKIEVMDEIKIEEPFETYRQDCISVSSGDDCGSGTFSESSDDDDSFFGVSLGSHERNVGTRRFVQRKPARTRGELLLEDLPPIEDLHITVDEDVQMTEIGEITSMVDVLVIVQSSIGIPPLDEDTILFLENKVPLGKVFETFGPVSNPLYSLRFNSVQQIAEKGIEIGAKVFYVATAAEWTRYVFMEHVKAMVGCDASWRNDNEPPQSCVNYSDDEEERQARARLRRRGVASDADGDVDDSSADEDAMGSPRRAVRWQRRRGRGSARGSRRRLQSEPKLDTWPPPDHPTRNLRGRRGRMGGRSSRGGRQLRTPGPVGHPRALPRYPFPPVFALPPSCLGFPPGIPPHRAFPPPPALTPPRFVVPHPRIAVRSGGLPPCHTGLPRPASQTAVTGRGSSPLTGPTSIPPPPWPPVPPMPPQQWTFGTLPPFPPPFPPPTPAVSSAQTNCWNRPPPPFLFPRAPAPPN